MIYMSKRKRDMQYWRVPHISKITIQRGTNSIYRHSLLTLRGNYIIKADNRQVYILKFVPPFKKGGFFYA